MKEGEELEWALRCSRQLDRQRGSVEKIELKEGTCVYLSLKGNGHMPVIHGPGKECGEFSLLERRDGRLRAVRDSCGTRPLYVSGDGKVVASDHRLIKSRWRLLQPDSVYDVLSGETTVRGIANNRFSGSFNEAASRLAEVVQKAVEYRVRGMRRVGVAFSGGLDSSTLARVASLRTEVVLCSVYAEGSQDSRLVERAADCLGLELAVKKVSREEVSKELESISLPFEPTQMDKVLWAVYSFASRVAKERGCEMILLGQMADELFGGYAKYVRAAEKEGASSAALMMEQDVDGCAVRGFVRDELACSRWIEPSFPFADREVFSLGSSLPLEFKISEGRRKMVLREAALLLGVPNELALAPKKAAQYSTGMIKLVA